MARKVSKTLTDGELRIMEIVWSLGSGSVRDFTAVLQKDSSIAYNTVQTMLRILEQKGYVLHEVSGRTFIYFPLVEKRKARSAAVKELISNFFDGSPRSLLINLLENEDMDAAEVDRIKKLISRSD